MPAGWIDRLQALPHAQSVTGDDHVFRIATTNGPATTAALQSLARAHRLTLNTLFQGAWALMLSRYSGSAEVLFGATGAGRPPAIAGIEAMAGLFITTLPVRVCGDGLNTATSRSAAHGRRREPPNPAKRSSTRRVVSRESSIA